MGTEANIMGKIVHKSWYFYVFFATTCYNYLAISKQTRVVVTRIPGSFFSWPFSGHGQWFFSVTGELAVDVGVTLVLSFSGLATLLLGRLATGPTSIPWFGMDIGAVTNTKRLVRVGVEKSRMDDS